MGDSTERMQAWGRLVPLGQNTFLSGYSTEIDGSIYLTDRRTYWTIGRGMPSTEPCDVAINASKTSASGYHAMIYRDLATSTVRFMNKTRSSSSLVGGQLLKRVDETIILYDNDEIWLGDPRLNTSVGFIYMNMHRRRPFARDFVLERTLGTGSFGSVYLAHAREQPALKRAVKVLDYGRPGTRITRQDALTEVRNLQSMRQKQGYPHANVIHIFKHYHDDDEAKMEIIVMEFVSLGDLGSFVRRRMSSRGRSAAISLVEIQHTMYQLCSALTWLHRGPYTIVHRDVKLSNLFVRTDDPWQITLADFGLSARMNGFELLNNVAGTRPYMAPEICLSPAGYDSKVDCYSAGMVLFFLLIGDPDDVAAYRFCDRPRASLQEYFRNRELNYDAISWRRLPMDSAVLRLARGLLETDPKLRYSMEGALHGTFLKDPALRQAQVLSARPVRAQPTIPYMDPIVEAMKKAMDNIEPVIETALPAPRTPAFARRSSRQTPTNVSIDHPEKTALPAPQTPAVARRVSLRKTTNISADHLDSLGVRRYALRSKAKGALMRGSLPGRQDEGADPEA